MFEENDIINLNELLTIHDGFKVTTRELRRLEYAGASLDTPDGLYKSAFELFKTRAKSNFAYNDKIVELVDDAAKKGIVLVKPAPIIPKVNVMKIGGSL